ncbi:DinB family protein [Maribacter thermophilus]|uniref:DinB family protein n=1 Tax=Maribacter thermophilus TaxID=1197874 RepID=UPI000641308F|nr:DinB family protein [Maribacter thermophilus]
MSDSVQGDNTEFWLRGPVKGIPSLLQPAAHALLQSKKELKIYTENLPSDLLWKKPEGRASIGFHIRHITGVLDRMMTYAKGKALTEEQFKYLRSEGERNGSLSADDLCNLFGDQVEKMLRYFEGISEDELKEIRTVGRKKLPSTVLGLLFHAAEHSQRHVGQLLVTVSWLQSLQK